MKLIRALRLDQQHRTGHASAQYLAFVGAGGKTTAMFLLARQLLIEAARPAVFITATTHLAAEQLDGADRHFTLHSRNDLEPVESQTLTGVVGFTGPVAEGDGPPVRVAGLAGDVLERLRRLAEQQGLPLLVEADGSRRRPLKAPAGHEPALPGWEEQVVVVAGLEGLAKPLSEPWVHRPELFAGLAGLDQGEPIRVPALAKVLASPQGGLKGIPGHVRRIALLNQADTPALQAQGGHLAELLQTHYHAVLVASLRSTEEHRQVLAVYERVAGIVLAAGGAERFGRPKQLLPWRGQAMVRKVVLTGLAAGLSPVIVVTGAYADEVKSAVNDLPVVLADNPNWREGQSTSIKSGLDALPPHTGAAVFLLSDQPQVPETLLRALVDRHRLSLSPIIAPQAGGRRANPVLFDRVTFPDLRQLQGDTGGRGLFSRYPIDWLPWHDENILLDVDTEADYHRLLGFES